MINSFETVTDYTMIQTFYADPEIVNNSGEVSITSVNLYFKSKPSQTRNVSGKANPGVVVRVCAVENDEPVLAKTFAGYTSRKSFDEIYSFSDASSATTFGFAKPLKLATGKFYGIIITFEDPGYELWVNKTGDKLVGTNTPSSGSNLIKDGRLFSRNNSGVFRALSDTDLKFAINCAHYTSNTLSDIFVNKDYEFLTVSGINGRFVGGEFVYQNVANATGNVAFTKGTSFIIGTGTSFETDVVAGDRIVLWSNTTFRQIVPILNVVNSTYLQTATTIAFSNTQTKFMLPPSGKVHYFNAPLRKLILVDSNANTTLKFAANNNALFAEDSSANCTIESIDVFTADRVRLRGDVMVPAAGVVNNSIVLAYYNGSTYVYDPTKRQEIQINNPEMFNITQYDGYLLSRSLEVDNANLLTNTDLLITRKSVSVNTDIKINLSNTELYQSPTINDTNLDMFVVQNKISNTYTTFDSNNVIIDTEVATNGEALSKHITKKVTFANNRFAEDIRIYMNAYRPANTELKVYARIHNSADPEAFDDKQWTPLEYKENGNKFSSSDNENDFIEYTIGLPLYAESANVLPGNFTTQSGNAVLVAAGVNPTTFVANNDVVKLYNPLIPDNYIIGVVVNANTTSITLGDTVSNNNLVGTGFKVDRLKYYNTAFNNITTDNVARYYNTSLVEYDKFDSMQIKIVMLSDTTYKAPKVDSIRVIGVSA
jgi:hypothetical protein